ncbi:MAG: L,D-transpeptidase family protein [bacterium]|jgi:lipoprotein-anchoring transpeptidase ErfK/SrfK
MSGLERVDRPRRWPRMLVVGGLAVGVIGLAGWFHFRNSGAVVEQDSTLETLSSSSNILENADVSSNEQNVSDVPVVTGATVSVTGIPATVSASVPGLVVESAATVAAEADELLVAEKKDVARERYLAALAAHPEGALRATIEGKLGKLNVEMIRLPWTMAEKQEYVVQTNDAVKIIARKFGTTVEMIVKGNELKRPDIIRPGQRLKVFSGKMEIVVSKSRHDLLLSANGRFFKRYQVATGRYEKTPVGTFSIVERIPEPPWHRDDGKVIPFGDKENILGTRWMAIKATGVTPEIRGYGIHGTWDNASIGKSESAGCIRLRNEDVEELFEMVPVGTSVIIEE